MSTSDEQDLGERDQDEPSEFPPAERVIHTQAYDLSLNTLKEQWDDQTLTIPQFQRDYVWDNAKASRLIESLLLNIPIPILFFAETPDATYEIVDGHQRVYSIVRYMDNQYQLSGLRIQEEFKGLRFHQLPPREQRFLKTRTMRAIIIGVDSSPTMKFEVFERLNTGGLALNAQEVRNALNQGPFNELLAELETTPPFLASLGVRHPRRRMVDRELILRFFAARDRLGQYRTPLLRFLNDYMRDHRHADEAWLEERRRIFLEASNLIHSVLGSSAFRVTDPKGRPVERSVNRALYESQFLAFSFVQDAAVAIDHQDQLKREIAGLFSDPEFDDAIRRATGDRSRTFTRVRLTLRAFARAGVEIDTSPLESSGFKL